ncbi:MAG TPA: hypothetical protein VGM91_01935 [Conexibacter sp.]|jgi:hypothetical protein
MIERFNRTAGIAALIVALLALVLAVTIPAGAAKAPHKATSHKRAVKAKTASTIRLVKNKIPAKYLPVVPHAKAADRLGGLSSRQLRGTCSPESVDLGTWCLDASEYPLEDDEVGKNDFFFASQKCVELGGWLPSAAELIGAAQHAKLASTIDDDQLTATTDLDPTDGTLDRREMSSTLVTTEAGSSASGSEGVTDGSKGDPKQGQPDPVPLPANPAPETLQYVTVYDNHDKGGFAGSQPLSAPQGFRCAYSKIEGAEDEDVN